MATTVPFFMSQSFAPGTHTFTGAMPAGTSTVDATITATGGTLVQDPEGPVLTYPGGSITGTFSDSADGVTWQQRASSSFTGPGQGTIHCLNVRPHIQYVVVVTGPTAITASASGSVS